MTILTEPSEYWLGEQNTAVGSRIGLPYHAYGVSVLPRDLENKTVTVTYLFPMDIAHSVPRGPGDGNNYTVKKSVIEPGEEPIVELPHWTEGATVYRPENDEKRTSTISANPGPVYQT